MEQEIQELMKVGDVGGVVRAFDEKMKEGDGDVLLVGKGHALYQMGEKGLALECMEEARAKAETGAQKSFLDNFIMMIQGEQKASADMVMKAAGVHHKVHGGLLANGVSLHEGVIPTPPVKSGCETEVECATSTHALSSFTETEQRIIKHVSENGTTDESWAELSASLSLPIHVITATWYSISPSLKNILESDPEMPCGHTCGTCPTKTSCHLHDELVDLEDL